MRVEKPAGKKLFSEEQQIRQWWFWTILIGVCLIAAIAGVVAKGQVQVRKSQMPDWAVSLIGLMIPLANVICFYIARFETVITDEGVYIRWWPFRKKYKEFRWSDIRQTSWSDRSSLSLGAKYHIGYGWRYQISGRKGVELDMGSSKVWIGTTKLNRFLDAIRTARPEMPGNKM